MVNSVSFGTRMGVFDKANVNAPQTFARPQTAAPTAPAKPAKKHSAAKWIVGTVVAAAVAAGLVALGAKKGAFDVNKIADMTKSFKDSKWISWAKKPAKAVLNALDTAGKWMNEKGGSAIAWVKGKFTKAPAAPAAPTPGVGTV